ncbi:uncharacterized protein PAN0_005d2477 [Moesziomyces antarcticus]|uniref:Uncharacterized protein n=2 Tax=Pseudozyma antarctica TaxID=84753 RepID=A0A5C3FP46_PSEA2|nr:uncharacterized protein PAN0_005d2477 [Moesziomyces antarcticus]GAK64265.1 hypothetical protein PAN0_005d2477 [Moesziomyces antarcticus]SPO45231.1 uncharacterized protein PSANT_02917 [Moesziomyces antarcticus]
MKCVRSHVEPQQPSNFAATGSSSQQSREGGDHSADFVGAGTIPQQSQEETILIAASADAETRSNHQDRMAILPSSLTDGDQLPDDFLPCFFNFDQFERNCEGQAVSPIDPTYSSEVPRQSREGTDSSHVFPEELPDLDPLLPLDWQEQAVSSTDPSHALPSVLPDGEQPLQDWQEQAVSSTDPSHVLPSVLPDGDPVPQDWQGQAVFPIDPDTSVAFSQQSQEGGDHPAELSGHGLEGIVEPFDFLQFLVQLSSEGTGRSFQSIDRSSSSPLPHEDTNQSLDMEDSETDSEQSRAEAPRTPESLGLPCDPPYWATPVHSPSGYDTLTLVSNGSGTFVRVTHPEAIRSLNSHLQEVCKGYLAADDDDIEATLCGRQFSEPLQDFGYRLRRQGLGYKLRRNVILDDYAKYFDSVYNQPSLLSFYQSCKQQPAVPEGVWICIKSESFIPVGTVLETLPKRVQESQLEQVNLEDLSAPQLQLIIRGLWETYGSSI